MSADRETHERLHPVVVKHPDCNHPDGPFPGEREPVGRLVLMSERQSAEADQQRVDLGIWLQNAPSPQHETKGER